MREGIYLRAEIDVPPASMQAWRATMLRAQHERLRGVKGFDKIDMGDDDLLGCEVTVRGKTSFEEALAVVRSLVDPARIERWSRVVDEGMDAIRMEEAGPLRRDADVAELLAYLRRSTEEGTEFVEVQGDEGKITLRGFLSSYDEYRNHRMPLVYALAAAGAVGGSGRLTFLGESEGEFVTLFVDVGAGAIQIAEPDPQNLDEEDWEERLGGMEALGQAYEAWRKKSRKKRRGR